MRRWVVTSVAVLTLSLFSLRPSFAYDVEFEGEPPENREALGQVVRDFADSFIAVDSVKTMLTNAGYLAARVNLVDSTVVIEAGSQASLEAIEISGDSIYRLSFCAPLTRKAVDEAMQQALLPWHARGYWYAALHMQGLTPAEEDEVIATARLAKGPVVTVEEVAFPGLRHTRPEVLAPFIPLQPGDTLTPALVSQAHRTLSGLDLIRSAGPIEVLPAVGYETATLRIPVEEPRQFTLEGAAGLAGDDSESRDLLWSLRARVNSLFGYGRSLTLHTERPDRGRHDLALAYRQPLYLLGPSWLTANLSTRDYRDQFYEFAAKGNASAAIAGGLELGLGVGWKTVSLESARPSFDRFDVAVTFDGYDLDERLNPASGWHTNWRLVFSHRRYHEDTLAAVPGMTALEETRAQLLVARYQPILQRLLLHLELNYDGLQTQEDLPPVSELTLLGGPTTIRGFRSEQFVALQAAWGTVEPRIRYQWGFVGTFVDMAYLRNRTAQNEEVITEESFEYGYGIELGLTGSRGGISVSLAWNPQLAFDQPYLAVRFNSEL